MLSSAEEEQQDGVVVAACAGVEKQKTVLGVRVQSAGGELRILKGLTQQLCSGGPPKFGTPVSQTARASSVSTLRPRRSEKVGLGRLLPALQLGSSAAGKGHGWRRARRGTD